MLFRRFVTRGAWVLVCAAMLYGVGEARAQALDDDDNSSTPTSSAIGEDNPAQKAHIGVGIRLRNVRIPEWLLESFIEDVPGGVSNFGIGGELSRRRGNFEVQFGLEYEHLTPPPGYWVEKGKPVMGGNVDKVRDDGFRWITAELSFMYHTPIIKQVSVRYGGGAGIGLLLGKVRRTDQICLTSSTDSCSDDPTGANQDTPYDIPPVMLVVNAVVGLQIRPTDEIFINIEGGIRTIPFFGTTVGYYF